MAEGRLWHAIAVALGMLALLVVALRQTRKVRVFEDFAVAGRSLSLLCVLGTLVATWVGTSSLFDHAEEAYRRGIDAYLLPLAASSGLVFLWYAAARVRRFAGVTIQDLLEARFGPPARVLGAITLIGTYLLFTATQFRAGGAILGSIFPWLEGGTAMALMAVCVMALTGAAGLHSVARTDLVVVILVGLALLVSVPLLLSRTGGYEAALASLPPSSQEITYGGTKALTLFLPGLLFVIGDANLFQRMSAAPTEKAARASVFWMLPVVLALQLALVLVAILAAALVAQGHLPRPAPGKEQHVLLQAAFETLPAWLSPLVIASFLVLIVASADSFLLTPVCVFVRDLYRRFLRPDLRADKYVFFARVTVVFAGLVALWIALLSDEVFAQARLGFALYGAALVPVLLAAYFWPRATSRGATSSMLGGILFALLWHWFTQTSAQDALHDAGWVVLTDFSQWSTRSGIDPVLPAFLVSSLLLVAVSLAGAPPEERQAQAFQRPLEGGKDSDSAPQPPADAPGPADTSST